MQCLFLSLSNIQWLCHLKWLSVLIVEVLHDIISNSKQFSIEIQCGGWPPSWICWSQRPPIKIKMSPSYSAWSKKPFRHITWPFKSVDSFAPIPHKIGPWGLYIGANDPRGGIFALGNMCFHKPGSDRGLWVPWKFCHQGLLGDPSYLLDYFRIFKSLKWIHLR